MPKVNSIPNQVEIRVLRQVKNNADVLYIDQEEKNK